MKELNNIDKDQFKKAFKTPVDYFEHLDEKIISQLPTDNIEENDKQPVKIIQLIKPWLTLAGIFIFVALIYYSAPSFFSTNNSNNSKDIAQNTETLYLTSFDESDIVLSEFSTSIPELDNEELYSNLSIDEVEDLILF